MAVAVATTNNGVDTGSVSTIDVPVSAAAGWFLVVCITHDSSAAAPVAPAGWSTLAIRNAGSTPAASSAGCQAVFYKVATGSETTTAFTVSGGSAGQMGWTYTAYSGVRSVDTVTSEFHGTSDYKASSLTPSHSSGVRIVPIFSSGSTGGASTPSGFNAADAAGGQGFTTAAKPKVQLFRGTGTTGGTALADLSVTMNANTAGDIYQFVLFASSSTFITAPSAAGTVSTGGPTLTVSWSAVGQTTYRVQVWSADSLVSYYNSGTVTSAATSVVLDPVALGIPTDTTGLALRALVLVGGSTDQVVFDVQWGVSSCVITSPANNERVTDDEVSVSWTFGSTRSKTQGAYRVRLLSTTGVVLHDSGWVVSASTTTTPDFTLTDNTTYVVGVQVKNSEGMAS